MKQRLMAGLGLAGLMLSLTACGGGSAPPPAVSAPPPAAQQQPVAAAAPQWRDLNGARGSSGEGELQRRGFEVARRQGLTTYWGHIQSQTCLRVVTSQGRYSIRQVPFVPNCPV